MNSEESKTLIKEIDNSITVQLAKLVSYSQTLEFEKVCEFILDENIHTICDAQYSYPGLYLFDIRSEEQGGKVKKWMDEFTDLWRSEAYHLQWTPGIKNIRKRAHTEIDDWVPLYIGKSKNVGNRINEHILKELKKTTFAMKLKARKNLYGRTFRIKVLKMDVENYDVLVPHLELLLRNILNPIVGKQ